MQALLRVCEGKNVIVKDAGVGRGKGVFSTQLAGQGANLWSEFPLVVAQHRSNKHDALVCSRCMKFLGTAHTQLQFRLADVDLDNIADESVRQFLHSAPAPAADPVPCFRRCTEYYCSENCRNEAWTLYHEALCPGDEEEHPIAAFLQHADETNDVFRAVGILLASVYQRCKKFNGNLDLAMEIFSYYERRPWWDVVALPEDVDPSEAPQFYQEIRELATESFELLQQTPLNCPELAPLMNLEMYAELIGIFEINCMHLEVPSPISGLLETKSSLSPELQQNIDAALGFVLTVLQSDEHVHDDEVDDEDGDAEFEDVEDEEDDEEGGGGAACVAFGRSGKKCGKKGDGEGGVRLDPPATAIGLLALQGVMNHSCEPNVSALRLPTDNTCLTTFVANRDIQKDEELTVSYIDEEGSYQDRQEALRDYGFVCTCGKCLREKPAN